VRPRIPLAYAGILVIALVAVIGFAAFSPSSVSPADELAASATVEAAPEVSARIASAVLAIRITDSDTRVATTEAPSTTTSEPETEVAADEPTTTSTESVQIETSTSTSAATASDTSAPAISITSPHDGDTVGSSYVIFEGTAEPGAYVRSGPFDADVDDNGNWTLGLALIEGANRAILTAIDEAGNTTEIRITVNFSNAQETTTTTHAHPATTTTIHIHAPSTSPHIHATTTTAHPHSTPTTQAPAQSGWSPLWPADAGGIRSVEAWRPLVAKYWAADRVDCVLGIIKKESRGDPRAYNASSGASGVMQHLIKYWKGRAAAAGFRDSNGLYASPYNAEANIAAGAYIAGSASDWYTPWSYTPAYGSCPDSRG